MLYLTKVSPFDLNYNVNPHLAECMGDAKPVETAAEFVGLG
jgi:hypothetical protein